MGGEGREWFRACHRVNLEVPACDPLYWAANPCRKRSGRIPVWDYWVERKTITDEGLKGTYNSREGFLFILFIIIWNKKKGDPQPASSPVLLPKVRTGPLARKTVIDTGT